MAILRQGDHWVRRGEAVPGGTDGRSRDSGGGGNPIGAQHGLEDDGLIAQRKKRDENLRAIYDRMGGIGGGPAPVAAGPTRDRTYYEQVRARQQALIDQLHGYASGQVKSPAQVLFEQQVQQAQNQSMGTAASLRDVGPGGQQRIAQQNRDTIRGQGIEQGHILDLQQRKASESALEQLYNQQRATDMAFAAGDSDRQLMDRQFQDSEGISGFLRGLGVKYSDTDRERGEILRRLGVEDKNKAASATLAGNIAQGAGTAFEYWNKYNQGGGK